MATASEQPDPSQSEWIEVGEKGKPVKTAVNSTVAASTLGVRPRNAKHNKTNKMSQESGGTAPSANKWLDPDDHDKERVSRNLRSLKLILPRGGKDYSRKIFIEQVTATCGLDGLEACGPTAAPHIWQLTFISVDALDKFKEAGDFKVGELDVKIMTNNRMGQAASNQLHYIRLHWVPYNVPMKAALANLGKIEGLEIKSVRYECATRDGMPSVRSLVRSICVETQTPEIIPYTIDFEFEGKKGKGMITMRDRPPICLKCNHHGHTRKDCPSPKCRVCKAYGHDDPQCKEKMSFAMAATVAITPEYDDMDLATVDINGPDDGKIPILAPAAVHTVSAADSEFTTEASYNHTDNQAEAISTDIASAVAHSLQALTKPITQANPGLQLNTTEELTSAGSDNADADVSVVTNQVTTMASKPSIDTSAAYVSCNPNVTAITESQQARDASATYIDREADQITPPSGKITNALHREQDISATYNSSKIILAQDVSATVNFTRDRGTSATCINKHRLGQTAPPAAKIMQVNTVTASDDESNGQSSASESDTDNSVLDDDSSYVAVVSDDEAYEPGSSLTSTPTNTKHTAADFLRQPLTETTAHPGGRQNGRSNKRSSSNRSPSVAPPRQPLARRSRLAESAAQSHE